MKRGVNRKRWTEKEDDYLSKKYYEGVPVSIIASKLRRTEQSVYHHARLMGFKRRFYRTGGNFQGTNPKTIDDVQWRIYYLRRVGNLSSREIGEKLRLSKGQIQHLLYKNGLHLHPPAGDPPIWFDKQDLIL